MAKLTKDGLTDLDAPLGGAPVTFTWMGDWALAPTATKDRERSWYFIVKILKDFKGFQSSYQTYSTVVTAWKRNTARFMYPYHGQADEDERKQFIPIFNHRIFKTIVAIKNSM